MYHFKDVLLETDFILLVNWLVFCVLSEGQYIQVCPLCKHLSLPSHSLYSWGVKLQTYSAPITFAEDFLSPGNLTEV